VAATAVTMVFGVFFLRHLSFAIIASKHAQADMMAPPPVLDRFPAVSVLVACKNEQVVVEQLVGALASLDYPSDAIECIIVDDASTDMTGPLLDSFCAGHPRIRVLHRRPNAGGGKSGALNDALLMAEGEIIVVFDADHRPHPDVVVRLVRHFVDPTVAAVQGRCVISNADDSLVSQVVAADYLGGYLVNEYGRQALFELPAYGGANCAVRASSLRRLGGWNPGTVTEDTDLTLRLVLAGERVRYDVSAVDEEQAVTTIRRYWRQRYRWARGHQQAWRDYRAAVWRSPHLNGIQKAETLLFLFGFHLPVLGALGLLLIPLWLGGVGLPQSDFGSFALWTLLFLGPMLEVGGGLLISRSRRSMSWTLVYFMFFYVIAMALCTRALIDGFFSRSYEWAKTDRTRPTVEAAPR
jgi:cellulose synthase/poly-beta-1,6-N-acetylglucosamine synthase-like glycosyltransferase